MGTFLTGSAALVANDPYTTTTTKEHELGRFGQTADGRGYRYARAGAVALDPGKLAVAATVVANHVNLACAAAAVGANTVTVTLGATAVSENDYADGWLCINDVDGEGIAYRITGHPAANASATLVVTLAQPIQVALTANSEASLHRNRFDDVVISVTDQADTPVGIPNVSVAIDRYFWLQTKGECAALADETLAAGVALTTGTGVAGAVEALDAAGEPEIGTAIQAGVDTEYRLISLSLD